MVDGTPISFLSGEIVHKLLKLSASEFAELKESYALLPATRCERKTHCCSMLPEITLLEEKQCMIYEDRFFGYRAYGLWSLQH